LVDFHFDNLYVIFLTSDDVIICIISNNFTSAERVNHCEHFKTKFARIGTGTTKL